MTENPMGADAVPGQGSIPSGPGLGQDVVDIQMPSTPFAFTMPVDLPHPKPRRSRNSAPKVKTLPQDLEGDGPWSNASYKMAMQDPQLIISPQALGFLPSGYWVSTDVTFGDLVQKFFQRKNNANCRFPHKLFNALSIVANDEKMWDLIGAKWVTDKIFKIDKLIFGRLLGITAIEGGLFHRQGNFPSHGFYELDTPEVEPLKKDYPLSDVDMYRIVLLRHRGDLFGRHNSEDEITRCKWVNA